MFIRGLNRSYSIDKGLPPETPASSRSLIVHIEELPPLRMAVFETEIATLGDPSDRARCETAIHLHIAGEQCRRSEAERALKT